MRGISLPRVGATATKGGPCGPRDSKRGQRITKNTDRRSNTLSSLSLILPSFLPSFLRERNHLTHALGGGGGGSSQSVPFPYERTPNLQTWSSPFPRSLARRIDLLKLWIHERRVLFRDTCLVLLFLIPPEGRRDPKLYKRKGHPMTDAGLGESAAGVAPLAACDRSRVVCRSVGRSCSSTSRNSWRDGGRPASQRVRRPRMRTRGDLNICLDLYLERATTTPRTPRTTTTRSRST
jgi:hypothetical protein